MLVLTSLRITPCSHLREPKANLGKSMDWTSTFPGPAYTTPRLFAIYVHSNRNKLKRHCAGLCHHVILLAGAAANSHRADNLPISFQRDAASEDHDAAMIGNVNSEELAARLRMLRQVPGRDIEGAGGKRLIDRYVDAADPGPIHADMGNKIPAFVDNRDVHRLSDFSRFLFSGFDNLACFLQCDHRDPYA